MKQTNVKDKVSRLILPVLSSLNLSLWDVEFQKEGGSYFLRIYIDKKNGVTLDDCERASRAIDPVLDEGDVIAESYYLEVSSPGIDRKLVRDEHFEDFINKKVDLKLYSPVNGKKLMTDVTLLEFSAGEKTILIEDGEETFKIPLKDCSFVRAAFV